MAKKGLHSAIYLMPYWLRYALIYPLYSGIVGYLVWSFTENWWKAALYSLTYVALVEGIIVFMRYNRGWDFKINLFNKPERNILHDVDVSIKNLKGEKK